MLRRRRLGGEETGGVRVDIGGGWGSRNFERVVEEPIRRGAGRGSVAPQRETLKLGFREAAGGGGKGYVWSVVLHFGPPVYVIWPDHFQLGRLAR